MRAMKGHSARLIGVGLAALCAAVASGVILGGVGAKLYVVLGFPALCGVAVGATAAGVGRWTRAHWPRAVTAIGAASGVVAVAALLVIAAQLERASAVTEYSKGRGWNDARIHEEADRYMAKASGDHEGILQPLWFRLHAGARLFGETPLNVGPWGNLAVLLLEVGVCGYLAARLARRSASEPFCSRCDAWYARRVVGTAPLGSLASVRAALQNGQFHKLGRRLEPPGSARRPVTLHGRFCDTCDTGRVVFELEVSEAGRSPRVVQTSTHAHDALDAVLDSHALRRS